MLEVVAVLFLMEADVDVVDVDISELEQAQEKTSSCVQALDKFCNLPTSPQHLELRL